MLLMQDEIFAIKNLFNNYEYMKKNLEELKEIKNQIIHIINYLDDYKNNAIVDLAFEYKKDIENQEKILDSKMAKDAKEFYENYLDEKQKFAIFLDKLNLRFNTLESGIVIEDEKFNFYDQIEEYIEANATETLEKFLNTNIIDLNFVPEFDIEDSEDEDNDDINNIDFNLPLIIKACEKNNFDIVKMLYYSGANIDVNISRPDGELAFTPLLVALTIPNMEMAKFLLNNNANPNLVSERDFTPLHLAILNRNYNLLFELINFYHADVNVPYGGNTPLHYACARSEIEAIDILLNCGANVNQHDFDGNTPLHKMIRVFANNWENSIKQIMDKFINHNFAINSQNQQGNTILHLLIERNQNHKILKHWLSKGARIDIANHFGLTPLNLAQQCGNIDILNFILEYQ